MVEKLNLKEKEEAYDISIQRVYPFFIIEPCAMRSFCCFVWF